jgi:signal transduction histidine kinase
MDRPTGQHVTLSVTDTGIGIKREDQERIFGEFVQVDSTYARRQQGTGLGLALTQRLVELHDGHIRVDSAGPGQGSTFTVVLPLEPKQKQHSTDPAVRLKKAPGVHPASDRS